jgi:hypothetical protein
MARSEFRDRRLSLCKTPCAETFDGETGTFGTTNLNRRLQLQDGNKRNASFANQRGALHFGLPVRVSSCKAAGDFSASECQVHANGVSMLVRDNFTAPFAILEGVRSGVIKIRVATQNVAVGQNNYPGCMASFAIPHVNTY